MQEIVIQEGVASATLFLFGGSALCASAFLFLRFWGIMGVYDRETG